MENESKELVSTFLKNEKVLIVEPSMSFAQTVMACLNEMGCPTQNIFCVRRYDEALQMITKEKPRILMTEYFIGERFGMALVDHLTKYYEDATKIAILATHNSSASAVAEAAEEHVDAYFLKPFSMGQLQERLFQVILKKVQPTDYAKRIRSGKKHLKAHDFESAATDFNEAMKLNPKPALAFYYNGYTKFLKAQFDDSITSFRRGLEYQPLHYKCLMGEFDSLFEQKKYADCHKLISTIVANYPVSPKRLGNIFIATVFSYNMHDVPKYFDLFRKLDHRPPELAKIFSAALMAAGKYFVLNKNLEKAAECFDMGLIVTGPDVIYIGTIIKELLKVEGARTAQNFLSKFPGEQIGQKTHAQLAFLIDRFLLPNAEVIERGRKLIASGHADLEIYRHLISLMVKEGQMTLAESVAIKAIEQYPDSRKELYEIIERKPVSPL